jgi:hypothetical protein
MAEVIHVVDYTATCHFCGWTIRGMKPYIAAARVHDHVAALSRDNVHAGRSGLKPMETCRIRMISTWHVETSAGGYSRMKVWS